MTFLLTAYIAYRHSPLPRWWKTPRGRRVKRYISWGLLVLVLYQLLTCAIHQIFIFGAV